MSNYDGQQQPGYTVVQFIEWEDGKSTAVVPLSWLVTVGERLMCYYPKKDVERAITKQLPAHADWPLYVVRRLTKGVLETITKAHQKQRRCLITSGVDSSDCEEAPLTKKKKSAVPKGQRNVKTGMYL